MPKEVTPSALWDAMTDEQKIEWLAKLEGYTNDPERVEAARPKHLSHSTYDNGWLTPSGKWIHELNRKYFTDWNHWREVEVEAVRNYKTWHEFMHILGINTTGTNVPADCSKMYVRTPLANRAKALFLASQ